MTLSVCAILRNESRYLKEWIEFHLLQGVERFYLYQNRSDDDWYTVLLPYVRDGIAEVTTWPLRMSPQLPAYADCIDKLRGTDTAVAFIDCDEFLFSPTRGTVTEALSELPFSWGALGVHWMCFGSSGHESYEPGLVTERFTWRPLAASPFNEHIKSIIRMDQAEIETTDNPHFFRVGAGTFNENGQPITTPTNRPHTSSILRINHYSSKSREEWLERAKLGKPDRDDPLDIDPQWYAGRQAMEVDDRDIHRFLPRLKEQHAATR